MPYTVPFSFDTEFQSKMVDLDSEQVKRARVSRDYLIQQIVNIQEADETFPRLYGGYKPFGSFARRTKIRPLDDIDLLLLLNGKGTEPKYQGNYKYWLRVNTVTPSLKPYLDDYGFLNSVKVLNKFKSSLLLIPNYKNTPIVRRSEAVVINLKSYDWSFDIVPAFPVTDNKGSTVYYLIPDGTGEWKQTDPRRDDAAMTTANIQHNGLLLPLIRLIKYWNTYSNSPPSISSYYLETMLINGLRYYPSLTSLREGVAVAFRKLSEEILKVCPDPKGLEPVLSDRETWETRKKVSEAAKQKSEYATYAVMNELQRNDQQAIYWWTQVFPKFPPYGG